METNRIEIISALIISVFLGGWAVGEEETAATPLGPCVLVAAKDSKTLYVANMDAGQVAVVDVAGGKVVRSIDMPAPPTGLALSPDGAKLFVTCAAPKSTVVVIDTASLKQLAAITVGHTATGVAVSPDGRRLYVCNRFDNDVSVIDLAAGKEIARVPAVNEPVAAAATPDGRTVVVANLLPLDPGNGFPIGAVMTLIDTGSLKTTTIRLPEGAGSVHDVCISPDGRYAVATHILSNLVLSTWQIAAGWINTSAISVIDLRQKNLFNHALLDDISEGAANPWGVRFSPDGKTLLVAHSGTHELSVIEFAPLLAKMHQRPGAFGPMSSHGAIHGLRRRVKLPGNGPRGIAVAGSKVFVAEYFSDTIAVVDTPSPHFTIPLGPKPKLTDARRGEMLFHDATICFEQWQSCASCHPDARSDAINWDLLNDGTGNAKNAKSLLYAHRTPPSMAMGVRSSAEEAVRTGIEHILFSERPEAEAAAIDEYLKTLRPVPSPRLVDGRLSPAAERGRRLFKSPEVGCSKCHPGPLYTDRRMHLLTPLNSFEIEEYDTPTLIEVWRTAPYRHDGKFLTVEGLLADGKHGASRGGVRHLTEQQLDDLVEFVLSL